MKEVRECTSDVIRGFEIEGAKEELLVQIEVGLLVLVGKSSDSSFSDPEEVPGTSGGIEGASECGDEDRKLRTWIALRRTQHISL